MASPRRLGKSFVGHGFNHDITLGMPVPSDAPIHPQQVFKGQQVRHNG